MFSLLRFGRKSSHEKLRFLLQTRCYCSHVEFDGDQVPYGMKTRVDILNEEDEGVVFNSYSPHGFLLNNGMRLPGPCVVFPKSVLQWNVQNAESITEDSLCLFTLIEPKPDLLILGVGDVDELVKIDPGIIKYIRTHRINIEILSTAKAVATFNFLNTENRVVAAAVIPPKYRSILNPEPVPKEVGGDREELSVEAMRKAKVIKDQRTLSLGNQRPIGRRPQHLIDRSKERTDSDKEES